MPKLSSYNTQTSFATGDLLVFLKKSGSVFLNAVMDKDVFKLLMSFVKIGSAGAAGKYLDSTIFEEKSGETDAATLKVQATRDLIKPLGTKEVDEAALANNTFPVYNSTSGKFAFRVLYEHVSFTMSDVATAIAVSTVQSCFIVPLALNGATINRIDYGCVDVNSGSVVVNVKKNASDLLSSNLTISATSGAVTTNFQNNTLATGDRIYPTIISGSGPKGVSMTIRITV